MDPAFFSAIVQGGVVLLGALGAFLGVVGRRQEVRVRDDRRTRRRLHLAFSYIDRLGDRLSQHGHRIPPPPPGLYDEDDEDPPPERRSADAPA
ncbi:MAG: hypothetical protein ACRCZP_07640 [Phycicoccus sp.]